MITEEEVRKYEKDGAIVVRNVFSKEFINLASKGIEKNLKDPSEYASENQVKQNEGRFFDDYCNWQRIDEFKRFILYSPGKWIHKN